MDGRPDGELYKQVMIRSFKIYLFRRALNFVEVEEEKHIDYLICLKLKYMMKLVTNHLINLVVLIIGEVLRKRKDVRGSSLFID